MTTLLITNGDSAAGNLRAAGLPPDGELLPWRDALHWGEVPDHDDPSRVADIRARAIATMAPDMRPAKVRAAFAARDAAIADHARFETVELWFEHDLYDQLQLVQVLDRLRRLGRHEGVTLVQADDYLGRHGPETIGRFAERAVPVTAPMLAEAARAWEAITAPTPAPAFELARQDGEGLPFLRPALLRWLEDLPGADGLARSERQILHAVQGADEPLGKLFARCQAIETAEFEGDLGFLLWVHRLALGPEPLVAGLTDPMLPDGSTGRPAPVFRSRLALTAAGEAVLAGRADHVALNGIDRWWGGTHLNGSQVWRWIDGALAPP